MKKSNFKSSYKFVFLAAQHTQFDKTKEEINCEIAHSGHGHANHWCALQTQQIQNNVFGVQKRNWLENDSQSQQSHHEKSHLCVKPDSIHWVHVTYTHTRTQRNRDFCTHRLRWSMNQQQLLLYALYAWLIAFNCFCVTCVSASRSFNDRQHINAFSQTHESYDFTHT